MKYVEFVNKKLSQKILESERVVLFGQNISAGSCLSGLTRKMLVKKGDYIINTPNCENTQCGVGFGLMINGVSSIFFMKQQDFLLLGIDHLVNTYNFIRRKKPSVSFTIVTTVVDNGYQGLQSSLNNFGDFCSIARVPGFAITNKEDIKQIINTHFISPGFRIIGVSQRLFKRELLDVRKIYSNKENTLFQYTEGDNATIVCFNFSFPYGFELYSKLKEKRIASSLFSVNAVTPIKWDKIIKDLGKTKKIVVIDDSKSENLSCYNFLMEAYDKCQINNKIIIKRDFSKDWLSPNLDQLEINYDDIIEKLVGNL
ncbi:2-oxoisovalerate dehydrogenase subunit beta [subsurface metagenome]